MSPIGLNAPATPTVGETVVRFWNGLPIAVRSLIPALIAVLIVLIPANLIIGGRFYSITTENLRAQHRALLTEIGSAFDELLNTNAVQLASLAAREEVIACAPNGCADAAGATFGAELTARLRDARAYYIELGFLTLDGVQTARALRGSGGIVQIPGALPLFRANAEDTARMQAAAPGQPYIFPIARDVRISPSERYQQPALRFAVPVFAQSQRIGYVTAAIGLDDFFAVQFAPSQTHQVYLLDADNCLAASSDETQRPVLYRTWSGASDRLCLDDLPAQDWDITVQNYRDYIFSTRVIHGPLSLSGQRWTIVIQQPAAAAYAQANALQTLLTLAHLTTIVFVGVLIVAADRAVRQLAKANQSRLEAQARAMQFNPYISDAPVVERSLFTGRSDTLAQAIGLGVMGGDGVLIEGDQHIGKTSLLRQIERRLRERQIADPNYRYWPVVFDTHQVPASAFYARLMAQMLRELDDPATSTDLRFNRLASAEDEYMVDAFHEDVNELVELPNAAKKQTRLVLCIDNIHAWLNPVLGYDQAFRSAFCRLFTGVSTHIKLIATAIRTDQRIFQDYMLSVIWLGPLEADEVEKLIRQPVADYYTFSDEAVAHILEYSDRLPAQIQRLARYAVAAMLAQEGVIVTKAHAEEAVQQAIAEQAQAFYRERDWLVNEGVSLESGVLDVPGLRERELLYDVAYTAPDGSLRLMTLFRTWLRTAKRASGRLRTPPSAPA